MNDPKNLLDPGTRWMAPNGQRVTVTATGSTFIHFEVDAWPDAPVSMAARVFRAVMEPAPATDEDKPVLPAAGTSIYGAESIHMKWEGAFYYADGRPMLAGDVVQVQTGSQNQGTLITTGARIVGFSTIPVPDSNLAISQVIVRQSHGRDFRVSPARTSFIGR